MFDDFDGDGLPDLFITSLDSQKGSALSSIAVMERSANVRLQPVWTSKSTPSTSPTRILITTATSTFSSCAAAGKARSGFHLLRNKGDAVFEDVTVAERPRRTDRERLGRMGRL